MKHRGIALELRMAVAALAVLAAASCAPTMRGAPPRSSLGPLREAARSSTDGEVVGQWALGEMLAPGGTAERAAAARARLEVVRHDGLWASLARASIDDAHGSPRTAAAGYVGALMAATTSADPRAPLVAWFAVRHLMSLRGSVTDLFAANRETFDRVLARPGNVGWRAVADLEDWRAVEVYDKAERTGDAYDEEVVRRMGCVQGIRLAGPFGHGSPRDRSRSFDAELPGPWPFAWPADPMRGNVAHVLSVKQTRCFATADEQVQDGVFYAEAFFDTSDARELIVAVQGAIVVWVDGTQVLHRGVDEWGSWQRFGAHISVERGHHRIVARSVTPGASVHLLNPDGTAAGLRTGGDVSSPVVITPPVLLPDPNPLEPLVAAFVSGEGTVLQSPIDAALAAYAAHVDQMDDVSSALIDPWIEPRDAGPLMLQMAAAFVAGDPALPEDAKAPRSRALRSRALAGDGRLWRSRLMAILDNAEQHGAADAIDELRRLAQDEPDEPDVLEQVARVFGRLGWRSDQLRSLADLARRFPDDVAALRLYLEALDELGPGEEAQRVAARIARLDPDADVDFERALARRDYKAAVAELERMSRRRPERKDLTARLAEVLTRAGDTRAGAEALEKALAKHPLDAQARFRLADRAYAAGDGGALRRALAAALQVGAPSDDLRAAIDLVEGATDLEPYRQDGIAVINEYRKWEGSGHHMDGTAARVLDYAAIVVHDDGSSEMLEHEIQKMQSQEAINAEAETAPPSGLVLHHRVIKADGRVLEPELVAGKPTLTLPHLEVGDFVELEHISSQEGDGAKGRQYRSPHWFFREADKGYWRSEFVVATPSDRELEIETRGAVPAPAVRSTAASSGEGRAATTGTFVERRWRVDLSPPAEVEPESPPITEFLPSVRVGWGVSLNATLARLVDFAVDDAPVDPRLVAVARRVVEGVPPAATDERARKLYRYVVDHVQDGKETDGRRVVTGGSGSRQAAFRYMCKVLGIETELALVKNLLAAPPLGPLSEVEQYDAVVLRLVTDRGVRWMTVRDKFAPFGYVPAELRGQPAIRLVAGTPSDVVHASGAMDAVSYGGRANARQDGSASVELTVTFSGNRAIAWRNALDQIAQVKLYDFVERELVAPSFAGGHIREMKVDGADQLDVPLVMHLRLEVPELAKPVAQGLVLRPPLSPSISQLAALPARHTPLLIRSPWRATVKFRVVLPDSTRMPASVPTGESRDGEARVTVRDAISGHAIDFDRVVDVPAIRIQPGDPYAAWQRFVRDSDALLSSDVLIGAGR